MLSPYSNLGLNLNYHTILQTFSGYRGIQAQVKPDLWMHVGPRPVESGGQARQRKHGGLGTAPAGHPVRAVCEGGGRVVGRGQGGEAELSCHPSRPPPRPPTMVVPFREVLIVGGVNRPEVAFTVVASTRFDEAVVEGQVVAHTVPPVLILLGARRNVKK